MKPQMDTDKRRSTPTHSGGFTPLKGEDVRRGSPKLQTVSQVAVDYILAFSIFCAAIKSYQLLRLNSLSVLTLVIFWLVGLYKKQRSIMNILEIQKLCRGVLFVFFTLMLSSLLKFAFFKPLLVVKTCISIFLVIGMEHFLFFKLEQYFLLRGGKEKMAIYGNLSSYSSPHGYPNQFTKAFKRIADIVFSILLLIISSPLFIILAILIKKDSPGAVFFRQERAGKDGKFFRMFKFRTMYARANKYDYHPQGRDDARITGIGKMLRRTSFDELPQLMNVLRGEMSLVGPRPEMPFIVKQYSAIQKQRLRVKPGLTGLWQISADRSKPIHENMEYDIYYINNQSPLLDLAIILRTVISVIRGIGAH